MSATSGIVDNTDADAATEECGDDLGSLLDPLSHAGRHDH